MPPKILPMATAPPHGSQSPGLPHMVERAPVFFSRARPSIRLSSAHSWLACAWARVRFVTCVLAHIQDGVAQPVARCRATSYSAYSRLVAKRRGQRELPAFAWRAAGTGSGSPAAAVAGIASVDEVSLVTKSVAAHLSIKDENESGAWAFDAVDVDHCIRRNARMATATCFTGRDATLMPDGLALRIRLAFCVSRRMPRPSNFRDRKCEHDGCPRPRAQAAR